MTISVFLALLLGRNVGLRGEFAIGEMIGEQKNRTALRLLRFIVMVTAAIETVGALLLAWEFSKLDFPAGRSLYLGCFHSVSAFCNAGFSLFSDSFQGFWRLTLAPLELSALIILGGLGFGVLFSFCNFSQPKGTLGPHVRLVLLTSAVLTFGGTLLIWCIERTGALADASLGQSLVNAWFQSVTARTAGFNMLDLNSLSPATNVLTMLLMFIGAAPGSTGGGIKVTTFAVLLLLVRALLTGREHVTFRGRKVEQTTVLNAAALGFMAAAAVAAVALFLLVTQPHPPLKLLFEAVSAFGTVGLSLGVTGSLTPAGKLAIILLMFVGRVGPLTLLVMMRPRRRSAVDYPAVKVMIG